MCDIQTIQLQSYKIIQPIGSEVLFKFNLDKTNDAATIIAVYNVVIKHDINSNAIKNFLKKCNNSKLISMMLFMIPYDVFYDFYYEYEFMKYYWSKEMLNKLFERNIKNLLMKYHNDDIYTNELIQLTGRFNTKYNYTLNILNKRKNILEEFYLNKILIK